MDWEWAGSGLGMGRKWTGNGQEVDWELAENGLIVDCLTTDR